MRILFLLPFLLASPLANASAADPFQGTVECVGPYKQNPDPTFPPGSIRMRIAWDPIFKNTDVDLQLPNSHLNGVTLLRWEAPSPAGTQVPNLGGAIEVGHGEEIYLMIERSLERIPEGGPISEGNLDIKGHNRHLQCHEIN